MVERKEEMGYNIIGKVEGGNWGLLRVLERITSNILLEFRKELVKKRIAR